MKCCDNEINVDTKLQTRYNCTLLTRVKSYKEFNSLTLYRCKWRTVIAGLMFSVYIYFIVTAFHLCTFSRLTLVYYHSMSFMHFLAFDFFVATLSLKPKGFLCNYTLNNIIILIIAKYFVNMKNLLFLFMVFLCLYSQIMMTLT
jgi:hypothetical protein